MRIECRVESVGQRPRGSGVVRSQNHPITAVVDGDWSELGVT
jgi:hypothetical protein